MATALLNHHSCNVTVNRYPHYSPSSPLRHRLLVEMVSGALLSRQPSLSYSLGPEIPPSDALLPRVSLIHSKPCRGPAIGVSAGFACSASVHRDRKGESQSIQFDQCQDDAGSNGSVSLPRPLTSTSSSESAPTGSPFRVAYQGTCGAYSELAAETAYPNCEPVPCEQFDTAFEAVEGWLVDRAVLPIENSLGGSIHRNYDLLLRHRLHIVGEVKLAIRHCLLANPGVKIEQLKRVLSHPQALAQCEHTLQRFGLVREAVDDTAGAAEFVALRKFKDVGAVASASAAKIYGLNILAEDIQDDSDNYTRFLMLAREPIIPRTDKPFKTSIVFSLEQGPGALFKALAVFALRQINCTKIESRPLRQNSNGPSKCFDYLFYLDFEASMADYNVQNALGHLKEFATMLRVLGSYPADTSRI